MDDAPRAAGRRSGRTETAASSPQGERFSAYRHPLPKRDGAATDGLPFAFSAAWSPAALPEGGEAGLTCYYDERTHITFGPCVGAAGGISSRHRADRGGAAARPPRRSWHCGRKKRADPDRRGRRFQRTFACRVGGGERRPAGALTGVTYLADEGFPLRQALYRRNVGVYALYGRGCVFLGFRMRKRRNADGDGP